MGDGKTGQVGRGLEVEKYGLGLPMRVEMPIRAEDDSFKGVPGFR